MPGSTGAARPDLTAERAAHHPSPVAEMKLFSLALAALAVAQTYDTGSAVWREIRDFVDDFTEWASRNLVAVLIVAVGIAFLWGLVFAKPRRR